MTSADQADVSPRRAGVQLFALSFVALFFELMIIRWSPSVVRLVAYYANLMLISSFLGLGIGAMLARRKERLALFPILLTIEVVCLFVGQILTLPTSSTETRFYIARETPGPHWLGYVVLLAIFTCNAAAFVPLGQRIGQLFNALPPLRAYTFDLAGSLAGTLTFGAFSYLRFSPMYGMAIVGVIYLALSPRSRWLWAGLLLAGVVGSMSLLNDPHSIWSPYYYVTIRPDIPEPGPTVTEPMPGLRTMIDPPIYAASVNQDFYQWHGTIDLKRYRPENVATYYQVRHLSLQFELPYEFAPHHNHVAVMGAGGGMDVEAALLNGATQVEAVEIDPRLVALSRQFNASGVYDDPRVRVHINDARAFLRLSHDRYDLIVFGFLDSQALFSYMNNLRLDGYIYTIESLRNAWSLLKDDGVLSLSFVIPKPWLAAKLTQMITEATGQRPIVLTRDYQMVLIVPRSPINTPVAPGMTVNGFNVVSVDSILSAAPTPPLATDDWPYLYLSHRAIPGDYVIVIGILLTFSLAAVLTLRGTSFGAADGHFLFMGIGFLLLETLSIGDCSLYFGATWVVTLIVITGVLLMVLAANLLAIRWKRMSIWLYVPLIAALLLLYFVPRDRILGLEWSGRLCWALLIVPLPIFFAGLIFSTTFAKAANPASLFGANLIGAMIGGFCEYLGMITGHRALLLIVVAAYACSAACVKRRAVIA